MRTPGTVDRDDRALRAAVEIPGYPKILISGIACVKGVYIAKLDRRNPGIRFLYDFSRLKRSLRAF